MTKSKTQEIDLLEGATDAERKFIADLRWGDEQKGGFVPLVDKEGRQLVTDAEFKQRCKSNVQWKIDHSTPESIEGTKLPFPFRLKPYKNMMKDAAMFLSPKYVIVDENTRSLAFRVMMQDENAPVFDEVSAEDIQAELDKDRS